MFQQHHSQRTLSSFHKPCDPLLYVISSEKGGETCRGYSGVLNNITTIEPSTRFTTPAILFRMFKLVEVIGSFSLSTSEEGSCYFRSQPQR